VSSYWLEEPSPTRPETRIDGSADVAIVGAGVTGCSAALRLAQTGLRVRVHDRRGIAEGASGRNGGFASRGAAARYDLARAAYGAERAASYWRWTEEALGRMVEIGGDALRRTGSYRLAADEEDRQGIWLEYEALREDGLEAEWLEDVPGAAAGRFQGAISTPGDCSLQPARFVRRLAGLAAAAGAEIREHDPVEDVEALDADRVLVATDGYGHGLVPELADLIWPTRGQVIASEPLGRVLFDRPHAARSGFDYWQQLPDGRIVLGGFRDVAMLDELTDVEETTPPIQSALESFLRELVGSEVHVTHRWAGIFGLTRDLLPLVGPVPGRDGRVWVAAGYSGHGNVPGFACGELVADALLGRSPPQLELLDPARFLA
jgi:glycine/D-amino acid oxidase-like deaminating enzyme